MSAKTASTTVAKSAKKVAPANNVKPEPANSSIRVRMYRQGLGDCFLITLPGTDGPFSMVIDCGVFPDDEMDTAQKLKRVVADITTETNGKIDLLVVTHQHLDHVSGFTQEKDVIKNWKVGQVWTAWTEDPKDTLANKLRAERKNTEDALRMAVNRLNAAGATAQSARVSGMLGFMGAASGETAAAMDYAKGLAGKNLRFCEPGEDPIVLPQIPNFKFFVLGPPKDEKLLRKSDPSQGQAYGLDDGSAASNAMFLNALTRDANGVAGKASAGDPSLDDPFEIRFQIPIARAQKIPFFQNRYFGNVPADSKRPKDPVDQSWRRIDGTWLDTSETLALALDSATNNTSLVLAIENIETHEILLFPGDAQAGNWLSWQDLKWAEDDEHGKSVVTTGPDLLKRTIFYKVGHHGSHNATLSEKGLELMTHSDLTAMIPVNHAMALKKHWGKMPLPELVERLNEKAGGRVLRIDDSAVTLAQLKKTPPAKTSAQDWSDFTDRVTVTDLYFELSF